MDRRFARAERHAAIDAGAVAALGAAEPAAGRRQSVDGGFERGDAVIIRDLDGAEVGRGLVAYDMDDAEENRRPLLGRCEFWALRAGSRSCTATIW